MLDTNILLRSAQPNHPMHQGAVRAVSTLILRGDVAVIFPQIITEFWAVCTRSIQSNGLGLTITEAAVEQRARIEGLFTLLPETPVVFEKWKDLVVRYGVSGLDSYDARIVAAMITHGIQDILTFNEADFRVYQEINIITPDEVVASRDEGWEG